MFTRIFQYRFGLFYGLSTKQNDKFLADMAGDMALIVRNTGQPFCHGADHTVTGSMAIHIIGLFEMVDVAKGQTQSFTRLARYFD